MYKCCLVISLLLYFVSTQKTLYPLTFLSTDVQIHNLKNRIFFSCKSYILIKIN